MALSEVIFFSNACQNNAKYGGLLFFHQLTCDVANLFTTLFVCPDITEILSIVLWNIIIFKTNTLDCHQKYEV